MMTLRILLAFGLAAAGLTLDALPASAAGDGVCSTAEGVTVVVDFQELGGGVNVRCATGSIPSGFAALDAAGIDYQTTIRFSGFLCRIAGLPANDPCINASPATAYWSYWLAPRGGQWCYSNWGAGNRTPPPGTVEGWSFSSNRNASTSPPPRLAVPAAVPGSPATLPANDCDQSATAPKPPTTNPPATPAPTTAPPVTDPPRSGSGGGAPATPAPTATTPALPAPRTGAGTPTTIPSAVQSETSIAGATSPPGDTTTIPGATTTPAADTPSTAPAIERPTTTVSIDDAQLAGSIDLSGGPDEGSPVGVIVAAVIVVALCGGAVAYRRRNRG